MKRGVFIFWSIFIAAAATRFFLSLDMNSPDLNSCVKKAVQGSGVIVEEPERKEKNQIFVVNVERLALDDGFECGKDILIRLKSPLYPRFEYGDRVMFTGNLSKPFNFRSENGREFDYEGYLAKDSIFYEIKSAEVTEEERTPPRTGPQFRGGVRSSSVQSTLFSIKRKFVANLQNTLGEPHAALAAGLVVGEKSALGKDLLNDFRTVGLIHIVVLSGYNITIVADALRRLFSFLPRVWGIAVGGIGIAAFGILVGGGATVVRSCFMAGIALSADLIRRNYSVHRALILAGLIMLIENPLILFHDPSFQLSFLATMGLIMLSKPIEDHAQFITEKLGLRGIVASTLATQIFVSPYILYMMGDLSVIGLIVNILVLPIIPATMLFVFLTGVLGFIFPIVATYLGWATHLLLSYELFIVEKFADFPLAAVQVPSFSGWVVAAIYLLIFCVYAAFLKFSSTTLQHKLAKKSST